MRRKPRTRRGMTVPALWDEAMGRLRSRVTPEYDEMWLRPIERLSFDGATLHLRAPNCYIRSWFALNFLGPLRKEIQDLGHDIRVEFDADASPPVDTAPPPAGQMIKILDEIRLTMNDVKFGVRLMAVHQEAMCRTLRRWVDHLEDEETRHIPDPAERAMGRLRQQFPKLQRQGSPEASSEPERSRAIAGPSTRASSSGSIL